MTAAVYVAGALLLALVFIAGIAVQARYDLTARLGATYAEANDAQWFTTKRQCRGCGRRVRLMRAIPQIGYRCKRCTLAPVQPRRGRP